MIKVEWPEILTEKMTEENILQSVKYSSNNERIASVTTKGKIRAFRTGRAIITTTVTIDGITRSFQTEVTVKEAYIKLIESTGIIENGKCFIFEAKRLWSRYLGYDLEDNKKNPLW